MSDNSVKSDNSDNHLGRRLVARRSAAGLTAAEVASRAGVHVNTVSNAERGQHPPTIATLEALARVYGVGVPDLFMDPEEDRSGDD